MMIAVSGKFWQTVDPGQCQLEPSLATLCLWRILPFYGIIQAYLDVIVFWNRLNDTVTWKHLGGTPPSRYIRTSVNI